MRPVIEPVEPNVVTGNHYSWECYGGVILYIDICDSHQHFSSCDDRQDYFYQHLSQFRNSYRLDDKMLLKIQQNRDDTTPRFRTYRGDCAQTG